MAQKAPLRSSSEADDRGLTARQPEQTAAMALVALNNLTAAVAVIGPENLVLFSNPPFDRLLSVDAWAEKLRDWIAVAANPVASTAPREITLGDGLTFRIKMVRLAQGLLVTAEDISEQVGEKADAAEQARIDPLTLLPNRPLFRERLTELLAKCDPTADAAAVLTIDVDRVKVVNDTLGRSVGDALLRVVAERLSSTLKRDDIVARLGGHQFGVLQTGDRQPQSAAALAGRLVDLLNRSYLVEGHLLNIDVSIGIALIPTDGTEHDQIVQNADLALNRSKEDGGKTFRFFTTAMDEQMQARRALELDLRRALAMRELALVYQPQRNLSSRQITGFEALLRWHSPTRGLVAPADFIPLAEEVGVIAQIGEWVIRTACREAAGWLQPLNIAVNVSAVQFSSTSLISTILSALAEAGLDPCRLELEIIESVLMKDPREAIALLHKVRALGVRVSMDDFGTGYSSLSYLRSFPFDKIKIDQSFVRANPHDQNSVAIVRAIAALGKVLGMETTAEGVETEEQLARVTADGCTEAQGYLISRPIPPEHINEFLLAHDAARRT